MTRVRLAHVDPHRGPTMSRERELLAAGAASVTGIDEVGRGALAGPVAVGAVLVDARTAEPPEGLDDSKRLTARRRETLAPEIERWCIAHAVGWSEPDEIDRVGIVAALGLAAARALAALGRDAGTVILDGNSDWLSPVLGPGGPRVETLVSADRRCASVSAASVLAKVARDATMTDLSAEHPEFGWASNKGYGSAAHRAAIARLGPTGRHRLSWRLGGGAD